MRDSNRNFLIGYVLLVGLPLAGLLGILEVGRKLTAPISVEGQWKLDADPRESGKRCAESLAANGLPTVIISQSGKSLIATLKGSTKASGLGTINRITLSVGAVRPGSSLSGTPCDDGQPFSFRATVDPRANPRSMSGVVFVKGCSPCAPVAFRAAQQAP